jgi:hypothetical protein
MDVADKCVSANNIVSGRAITRMPGTALFKVEPKIDKSMTTTVMENTWTNRFDDRNYYTT